MMPPLSLQAAPTWASYRPATRWQPCQCSIVSLESGLRVWTPAQLLLCRFLFLTVLLGALLSTSLAWSAVREYRLIVAGQNITIRGKTSRGITINGGIPGPTLFFHKGDIARIEVVNRLPVPTTIHWHGILVPPRMDGVPYISQAPIPPGATKVYQFPIRQTGTYWYHSHAELQEQSGLYGAIVIKDKPKEADQDQVVLLSDWTTDSPHEVMRTLKRGSEWYSLQKGTAQSIYGAALAGHRS